MRGCSAAHTAGRPGPHKLTPARVPEPPHNDGFSGRCTEPRHPRPWTPTGLEEPASRTTIKAIVGTVTARLTAARWLLLGRDDSAGRLQYTGRTTTFPQLISRRRGPLTSSLLRRVLCLGALAVLRSVRSVPWRREPGAAYCLS